MPSVPITMLETNFEVEYDFKITAHGSGGTAPSLEYPSDPPEPAEFDIEILSLALAGKPERELDIPEWLRDMLIEELLQRDDVKISCSKLTGIIAMMIIMTASMCIELDAECGVEPGLLAIT